MLNDVPLRSRIQDCLGQWPGELGASWHAACACKEGLQEPVNLRLAERFLAVYLFPMVCAEKIKV